MGFGYFYYPIFWDPTFLLLIPALLFAGWAYAEVRGAFARFSSIPSSRGITGKDVAAYILRVAGIDDVKIEVAEGELTDHYDPTKKVLRLSEPVYSSSSLAAVAIAAHEAGHAIQHKEGNLVMVFRLSLVPAAGFASNFAFPLFFIGFLFGNPILMKFAIVLFGLVVLFHLVTLFVEYDASAKAKKILIEEGLIYEDECPAIKKLLDAAALTYVAALFVALAHLLRLLLLARMRERD